MVYFAMNGLGQYRLTYIDSSTKGLGVNFAVGAWSSEVSTGMQNLYEVIVTDSNGINWAQSTYLTLGSSSFQTIMRKDGTVAGQSGYATVTIRRIADSIIADSSVITLMV